MVALINHLLTYLLTDCTMQAELVYVHYGTWDDFSSVASSQDLDGKVVLVRSGVISLKQKVCTHRVSCDYF